MTTKFTGYCPNLPNLVGKTLTIPKGVEVHSFRTKKASGKSYKVTVAHTLNGMEMGVAYRIRGVLVPTVRAKDVYYIFEKYGVCLDISKCEIDVDYYVSKLEELFLKAPTNMSQSLNRIRISIPTSNPKVVWVGSGGYWKEVDINDIPEIVEGF